MYLTVREGERDKVCLLLFLRLLAKYSGNGGAKSLILWLLTGALVVNDCGHKYLRRMVLMKSRLGILFLALAIALPLGGCASKTTPTFTAKYYPECYDPIDKLCKDQSNKEEVKGAVAGGVIGALGGAIVGGLATGKVEGALVGAGVGAAAGAVTGFFAARLNKIKDQEQRLAEYQNVLGEQAKSWDLETASVEKAYQCYSQQIDLLQVGYKSKQISRQALQERMAEIKAGIEHINTYWADAQHRMDSQLADSDSWLSQQEAEAAAAAKQNQKRATPRTFKVARQKSVAMNKSVKNKTEKTNAAKLVAEAKLKGGMELLEEIKSYGILRYKGLSLIASL